MSAPKTLYEKIWDAHVVERRDDGTCLLYIDRHLVHEVTSPQAFEGLRMAGRKVRAARADAGGPRPQRADRRGPRPRGRSPTRRAASSSQTLERTSPSSASPISTIGDAGRASSTSSGRSRASPCPA